MVNFLFGKLSQLFRKRFSPKNSDERQYINYSDDDQMVGDFRDLTLKNFY